MRSGRVLTTVMLVLSAGCISPGTRHARSEVQVQPGPEDPLDAVVEHLVLEDAEPRKAIEAIMSEWRKALKGRPLPNTLFVEPEGVSTDEGIRGHGITCTLRNIPVRELLRLLPSASPYRVFTTESAVVFRREHPMIIEDWETSITPASRKAQRALDLSPQTSRSELTGRLGSLGLEFAEGMYARWEPRAEAIIMTNFPHQTGRLQQIIHMIDQDVQLPKEAQPAAATDG